MLKNEKLSFEQLIKENFGFVEKLQMSFEGVRCSGGSDPRDAALVARYSGPYFRFDIGWNKFDLSLSILIKFAHLTLPKNDSYVYLEPFIEFVTQGKVRAIVPYITEGMSIRKIEDVVEKRNLLFAQGLDPVIKALGEKMKEHFGILTSISQQQIEDYHKWMKLECEKTRVGIKHKGIGFYF